MYTHLQAHQRCTQRGWPGHCPDNIRHYTEINSKPAT